MVDDADYDWLMQWAWYAKAGYAARGQYVDGKMVTIFMHRVILGYEPRDGQMGDHEDRNPLNCQRYNLRHATRRQNNTNRSLRKDSRSGLKGAFPVHNRPGYTSLIQVDGKRVYLGYFATAEEAHAAYCAASAELHKEFSCTT